MRERLKGFSFNIHRLTRYFNLFMVLFYVVLGAIFIFSSVFTAVLNQTARVIFGCILVIYGIFRAYRAIKSLKYDIAD